ncbi:unnamed protein product [Parnassius mnemosyne]
MPQPNTPQEYANMHLIYGECRCNANAASRLYPERYPNAQRYPDYRVFINVHQAFSEGRMPSNRSSAGRPRLDRDEEVLKEIENDSTTSVRAIEEATGIPKSSAHRILKRHKLHPYHYRRVQTLLPRDYPLRVTFCRVMLQRHSEDPHFLDKILWSDETTCKKDGYLNLHNLHSWSNENPHLMRQDKSQYQFKVNLWTGILNGKVIGPFELQGNLDGNSYLNFLQNDLQELLNDVPLSDLQNMWFQNDGCPAHYARPVREYLNQEYPGRWIGRLGPILWPPRSPDLNPLDFFYWGCLKNRVYSKPIVTLDELRRNITQAADYINSRRYARQIKRSFLRRCRACINAGGKQFEHLL